MYETKVKQLETEFEGKSLQLAIKFEEENKKLIDDMQKQKVGLNNAGSVFI